MLKLSQADGDLAKVEAGLPALDHQLAQARRHDGILASIALANGANPDEGYPGEMRGMLRSCCDGIAYALAEARKHAAIVREYLVAHPEAGDAAPPADIEYSWGRAVSAVHHAGKELATLRATLES